MGCKNNHMLVFLKTHILTFKMYPVMLWKVQKITTPKVTRKIRQSSDEA